MTMTTAAARFLLRCTVLAVVIAYSTSQVATLHDGGYRLRGVEKTTATSGTLLPQRRLHQDDDADAPNESNSDTIPKISTETKSEIEELTLDSDKAEKALKEEEAASEPTAAPHHHSHHDDKKKDKDKKKHNGDDDDDETSPEPTPAAKEPKSPAPTKTPKTEMPTKVDDNEDAGNDADETETTPADDADDTEPTPADDEETPAEENKGGDDDAVPDDEDDEHGDNDFDEATDDVPTQQTTHTKKPATENEAEKDAIDALDDDLVTRDDDDDLKEELQEEKTEAKVFGGFGFLIAIIAMIFTAHQMSENPDGIYARYVTCVGVLLL